MYDPTFTLNQNEQAQELPEDWGGRIPFDGSPSPDPVRAVADRAVTGDWRDASLEAVGGALLTLGLSTDEALEVLAGIEVRRAELDKLDEACGDLWPCELEPEIGFWEEWNE